MNDIFMDINSCSLELLNSFWKYASAFPKAFKQILVMDASVKKYLTEFRRGILRIKTDSIQINAYVSGGFRGWPIDE